MASSNWIYELKLELELQLKLLLWSPMDEIAPRNVADQANN